MSQSIRSLLSQHCPSPCRQTKGKPHLQGTPNTPSFSLPQKHYRSPIQHKRRGLHNSQISSLSIRPSSSSCGHIQLFPMNPIIQPSCQIITHGCGSDLVGECLFGEFGSGVGDEDDEAGGGSKSISLDVSGSELEGRKSPKAAASVQIFIGWVLFAINSHQDVSKGCHITG